MSEQDPQNPKDGENNDLTPGIDGLKESLGSGDDLSTFDDPFGSEDPFGLETVEESAPSTAEPSFQDEFSLKPKGSSSAGDSALPAGSEEEPFDSSIADAFESVNEFEVQIEQGPPPLPPAPPARPEPPVESKISTTVSETDLSAISNFQRSRANTATFQSDDVFGERGASSMPPVENKTDKKDTISSSFNTGSTSSPRGSNPFDSPSDSIRGIDSLNLGRNVEQPPDTSLSDDPFASLGTPLEQAKPKSPPQEEGNFSSLLSQPEDEGSADPFAGDFSATEDPFGASPDDVFGAPFSAGDEGADPFSVNDDGDSFYVESAGVGGEGSAGPGNNEGEFTDRVTSSFKIGKDKKKQVVGTGLKISVAVLLVFTIIGAGMGLFTSWGWFGLDLLFPPRHEVVAQAPVLVPKVAPVKQGEVADTADAFIEEIKAKEKLLIKSPQDNKIKETVLAAHLNYRARFPSSYEISKKQFTFKVEQLKREIGLTATPRLAALDLIHEGKFDEAKVALETALAAESANAAIQFLYGRIAHEERRFDEALAWYKKAVTNDPNMLKAIFFQGQIYEEKQQFEEASARYLNVLRNNASHNTARLGLVRVRIATGDLAGAEQLANQALAEASAQQNNEDQFVAHKVLALLNKQLNRNVKRLGHLQAAVRFKPTDSESVVELVDHYRHEKDVGNLENALLAAANNGCTGPAFYQRLIHYFLEKDIAQAEIYADFALESHPKSAVVYILRGEVAERMGHAKSARSYYARSVEVEPSSSDGYLALASIHEKAGRYEAAARTLLDGEGKVPGSTDILLGLAKLYRDTAQVIKAKSIYEKILDQTPSNTRVRLDYAMLLTEIGYAEEAINQFRTLFSQGLTDNEATVGYATALSRAQRPREAIAQLNGLLRIQPQNVIANTQMGALNIELQSYKTAENYLRAALRVEPNHAPAYFELGRLRAATGKPKEAAQEFERAVELEAANMDYRFLLASAQAERKESRVQARRNLDQIISRYKGMAGAELATRNPNVYRLRGDIYFQGGDYKKALQDFELAMLIDTSNLQAISGLAVTLYKLNRVKESEAYFLEILSKDRENSEAHYYLGRIAHGRGDTRASEDHLLASVRRGEEAFADAHKTLGLMFRERKMSAPARRHLQLYLDLGDPSTEDRTEVQRILQRIR